MSIIYLGFRPKDSLEMHRAFAKGDAYAFRLPPDKPSEFGESPPKPKPMRKPRRKRNFEGMNPSAPSGSLVFDAKFECGNLDAVALVKPREYDLYMRVDANTKGHH